MNRRKRVADAEPEKDVASTSAGVKKRKGRMTLAEKEKRDFELAKGTYVMSKLRRHRNTAGDDSVFESFLRVPSRRLEPEYYEKVKEPIDITTIQHKLKNPDYSTYDEFKKDFAMFIKNNLAYYQKGSDEHKDMLKIQDLYKTTCEKVDSGEYLDDQDVDDTPGAPVDSDIEDVTPEESEGAETGGESSRDVTPMELDDFMLCDLLGAVLEATDSSNRILCPPFRVLQSREDFPQYYEKIAKPIDLKTIAQNGKQHKYATMSQLKDDLFLLFKNAQQFSGKGSDIWKDAEQLKQIVKDKIAKIEEKGVHPMRKAKSIRLVDALLTAVAVNDNFSEDSEEDEETENNEEPMWRLYWTIRNAADEKDQSVTLADNFLELPSKEQYPDYYDEIKQPVSIFMINKRLKNGQYDFKTLVADLMTMYSNAFEYNLESSEVCVAAQKLKTLTIATCKQLTPSFDMSQYEPAPASLTPQKPKATPHRRQIKIEMPDTDSEDSRTPPPSHKRKSPKKQRLDANGQPISTSTAGYKGGRKSFSSIDPNAAFMKQKGMMQALWNVIHQYRIPGNASYWPAGAFIELPSAKQYPEYYQIIQNPIDMKLIRHRIDTHQYPQVDAMIADCRLMFSNARDFNEPSSHIHMDAIQLERQVLRAYEGMRNQMQHGGGAGIPQPYNIPPTSMPTTPHSSSSSLNMMKLKTPKVETRGRKKKYPDEIDEEELARIQLQQQERRMEEAIAQLPIEEQKMWRLFKSMKDVREEGTNRPLAVNFMRLPTKEEFPAYYDVIKKPMDMMRIKAKLENRQYVTLLDVVSDYMLMLSNACKFNETDSDIYKEAVSLQKALLEMKRELDTGEDAPRVQVELRTIFTSIFASLFAKKDESGRCYADDLTEFTEVLKANGVPPAEWPYTLDQIKMNIDKCRYRRLDKLQKDFFDLFERARELSKVGSRMYEAACFLQKAFCVERDSRCKDVIHSNSYSVIEKDIDEAIEKERAVKAKEEHDEDGGNSGGASGRPAPIKRNESEVEMEDIEIEGSKYSAPCYAYISRTDEKKTPLHIFRIERTFKDEHGEKAVSGHWVYRPEETLHLANRKFMKQEVFITPFRDTLLADRLRGLCCVVSLATFSTKILTDFSEEDVYLCEYKYHGKPKYFSKLRSWPFASEDEELEFTKRQKTMTPKRILTAADSEGNSGKDEEDVVEDEEENEEDRARLEVALDIDRYEFEASKEDKKTFYQQIRSATGKFYWLGQFVLVFNPLKPLCDVMRINKIWRDEDGIEWFSGCWFARPSETIHDEGRLFFQNEVIGVYRNDETRKLCEIQRVCDVMPAKTYVKQRQTEISECDVFVCETMVNGSADAPEDCSLLGFPMTTDEFTETQTMNLDYSKAMRKMKTYKLNVSIPNEEVLFYKQAIKMEKELSPLLKGDGSMPLDHLDEMMDDDTDGSESVTSSIHPAGRHLKEETPAPSTTATPSVSSPPVSSVPQDTPIMTPKVVKSKSGYILFSAEVRKRIMHENPDAGFGEVSKIVGIEWKKLSEEQKKHYEMRAEVVAVEKAKQDAIKATQAMTLAPGQIRIFQCKWAACDFQYESEPALLEHVIQHHTSQIIMDSDQQFVCMWMTCLRNRKDGKPFPSLPRLHRHIKEKHMPVSARNVYSNQLCKNFFKVIQTPGDTAPRVVAAPYGQIQPNAPPGGQQNGGQIPSQNGINGNQNGGGQHHQIHPQQQMQQHHDPHMQQHYQPGPPQPHQSMGPPQQPMQNGMYQQQGPSNPQQFHQVSHQQMQQGGQHHPQQQLMQQVVQQQIPDVGRTVVRAAIPAFVAPPNQIHSKRVLHSEAYLKYIESLAQNRQKSVSRWERSLAATHRNTQPSNGTVRPPAHWIRRTEAGRPVAREEDVTKALWKLRDELLKSTCGLVIDRPTL
ncbi:hypothetical protein GCK72_000064 [Caenorhabditis remanei]|uniref:Protein polybromo-1 n=1 Tax=Caenorhabditis remanei TaxID=31234 RepID=A0A6A5HR23_CAERE|nr:hypothetical protein GCK72_000064 [Caenorhabditis remanei]KAF1768252.1 hypothetical protein GCK72_000064 [Caenorhabditis remanei]